MQNVSLLFRAFIAICFLKQCFLACHQGTKFKIPDN